MNKLTREQLLMIALRQNYEIKALKEEIKMLSNKEKPYMACEGDGNSMYQPGDDNV